MPSRLLQHRSRTRRQRGAALLTAMVIVTLVATLASAMVWQQWRAVQVEAAERARAQSAWILAGALDFARMIIKETVKPAQPTALTDPWATPLAEARLSTFLAADKTSGADDGPEAFLSGSIGDAQGKFNLRNLVTPGSGTTPAAIAKHEAEALGRLCAIVNVDSGVADRIATGLLGALTSTSGAAALLPETAEQLTWFGVDPAAVRALQPYVVLLPLSPTTLNVNTASKEVLAAVTNIDVGTAERMVQIAQRTPFKNITDFTSASGLAAGTPPTIDVHSTFFEVLARVRLVDRVLIERTLVERMPDNQVKALHRERSASVDQPGA